MEQKQINKAYEFSEMIKFKKENKVHKLDDSAFPFLKKRTFVYMDENDEGAKIFQKKLKLHK